MKRIANILYIEREELVEAGISENTIKGAIRRGSANWQTSCDPADNRRTLIAYEPLGQKYKEAICAKYGDPYQLVGKQELDQTWQLGEQIANRIKIDDKEYAALLRQMPAEDALEHARACAWLALLANTRKRSELDAFGVVSKSQLYHVVLKRLQREKLKPLKVTNKRVLQKRVSAYKSEGAHAVVHGLRGNKNAAKIMSEQQERHLLALMSDPHKPDYNTVTYLYNRDAEQKGWDIISPTTARRYLEQPKIKRIWWAARHGEDAYYQKYDLSILRKRPTRIDALWVLDGTPLDLYYYKKEERWNAGKQRWETRSRYYNRMDMILVADACSWRIVGAVLCEHENADAVRASLKQAVQRNMRLPKQLTYDQGSGMAAQEWMLQQLKTYNTPTRPYSAKAKVIENIIGHFQTKILRYYDNWAGQNVRAKKLDSHFNPDFLASVRDKLPTLEQLQQQFEEAVRIWNELPTKKRKAPNEVYRTTQSAGHQIDPLQYVELFWEKRKHEYPYRNDGIRITVQGQEHTFCATDKATVSQLLGGKYQVALDPDAMDYIYLYQDEKPVLDAQGEPLMLMATEHVPMAIDDYEPGDRARIQKLIELKDQVKQEDLDAATEIRKYAADNDIELGARYVYKDRLNDAEAAFKLQTLGDDGDDWEHILESKYLEE